MKPGDLAEQAGQVVALSAIDAILKTSTQAARCAILTTALIDLCNTPNERHRSAAGFAVALLAFIDCAISVQRKGK